MNCDPCALSAGIQDSRINNGSSAWKELMIIEQLEYDYNINKKLFPGDMRLCNRLYKRYKLWVKEKNFLT